jgi:formaldehyde-activating enzyme
MTEQRLILRTGDAGPPGAPIETVAYPELVIGELDGPVGTAFAILTGDQVYGHSRVMALLNTDVSVKPATLMVSKATAKTRRYCESFLARCSLALRTACSMPYAPAL